jgi:hypothetical protein
VIGEEWDVADNVDQHVTVGTNKFEVSHFKGCRQYYSGGRGSYQEYWEVCLPHQCDEFDVASSRTSHDAAVSQLETFIAEAQLALEALKGMP